MAFKQRIFSTTEVEKNLTFLDLLTLNTDDQTVNATFNIFSNCAIQKWRIKRIYLLTLRNVLDHLLESEWIGRMIEDQLKKLPIAVRYEPLLIHDTSLLEHMDILINRINQFGTTLLYVYQTFDEYFNLLPSHWITMLKQTQKQLFLNLYLPDIFLGCLVHLLKTKTTYDETDTKINPNASSDLDIQASRKTYYSHF